MYKRAGKLSHLGKPIDLVGPPRGTTSRKSKKRGKKPDMSKINKLLVVGKKVTPRPKSKTKHLKVLNTKEIVRSNDGTYSVQFSHQAYAWILERIRCHPDIKLDGIRLHKSGDRAGCSFTNSVDGFFDQLVCVVLAYDGTDFFTNLDLSYRERHQRKQTTHGAKTNHPVCALPSAKQVAGLERLRVEEGVKSVSADGPAIIAVSLRDAPIDADSTAANFARLYASAADLRYSKCFVVYQEEIVGQGRYWAD